jgi:hypothetical protein
VFVGCLVTGGFGDVELEHVGVNPRGAKLLNGLFSLGKVAGTDDDFDAGILEVECGLEPESAVSAGDECDFLRHGGNFACAGLDSIAGWRGAGSFPVFGKAQAPLPLRKDNIGRRQTVNASALNMSKLQCSHSLYGGIMRRTLVAFLAVVFAASFAAPLRAQGAPPQSGADQPYTVEYYYKCQWGHQQEFLQLFLKNHYPLLKKIEATGRILSVKIDSPAYHTTEDGRWDYRVTIRYKNSTVATTTNPDEEGFINELWPDKATYNKEEQRRFEILLGHWDLPVTEITPKN